MLQPFAGGPAFPILYHTSMIILAVALGYALWQRNVIRFNAVLSETAKTAYSPLLVTLVFVIMAQLTSTSGMAAEIAHAWEGIAHRYATLAAPLFAALSGALTGSNTASNSMMLPLQVAIANHTGVAADWVAALQNAVGSSFTLFSPSRIAMACSLVSIKVAEAAAYRAALPLGVIAAGVGFTAVVVLLLVS